MKKKILSIFPGLFLLFQCFLAFPVSAASAAEFIFIANRSIMQSHLAKDEIRYIYLGRKKQWDDGSKITFVVLKSKMYYQNFLLDFLGKTPEQFNHYWQQNVFTGNGQMPPAFDNAKDVLDFISKNEGSMGYVPEGVHIGDLKKIEIR